MSALISAEDLHAKLGRVVVVDATYGQTHGLMGVPFAVNFDIDDIADPDAVLPHTIPSADIFADKVGQLGISNDDEIVVYDETGIYMAAARVWWMFRLFGHDKVRVLDGGLPAWQASGFGMQPKNERPIERTFEVAFRPELLKSQNDIRSNVENPGFTVLDARDALRFSGAVPEARPGVVSGHIPGSLNIPFMNMIDLKTGKLQPIEGLRAALKHVGMCSPVAASCGSGVTAGVIALGLYELGLHDVAIYDGSWTEWGSNPDNAVATNT